jgi:branched-chain amino acid transport system ATP-binding protein
MAQAALTIDGIGVSFSGFKAVDCVSLIIDEGELRVLLGANGAGKTSLLRGLSGLLAPAAGSIRFDGQEIAGGKPHRIARRGIVQVPEGRQLFAGLSVADNLRMGAYLVRNAAEIARRRAAVLDLFPRLGERLGQAAGLLSGGEQQMLAIGRALMAEPRLLLLDEPSMGLAPLFVDEIFAIIARLKQGGRTILLVEQNARAALDICDHAYVLETGRITLSGPAAAIAEDPRVVAAYLGAA